jgi:hypothetical protein
VPANGYKELRLGSEVWFLFRRAIAMSNDSWLTLPESKNWNLPVPSSSGNVSKRARRDPEEEERRTVGVLLRD